ncbi:hypothetical protein BS17DRAFT_704560, partial [Gyrodon lividus]
VMYPLSSSDEPFRVSLRDNRGIPTLLSPWEFLEDYGIVHPSGCDVCTSYMKHVADASYSSHQPAFQIAFQDRKRAREDVYNKGLSEGSRRQKEEERELVDSIERYRFERNQAREELFTLRAQLESSRADCERLQEKLKQTSVHVAVPPPVETPPPPPPPPPPVITKLSSADPSIPLVAPPELLQLADAPPTDTPVDLPSSNEFLSSLFPHHVSPSMATPASPQAQLPDCVAARSFAAVLSAGQPPNDEDSGSQSLVEEQPGPQSWQIVVPQAYKATKPAKTIKQIQSLIKAAHQPGNYQALTKVKALCSEAHRTPREQKTEVQRYLLSTWRTPDWEHPTSVPKLPAPLNNPRLEDPVECWVAYYTANPSSCPKGIRRDADGKPSTADMRASRTVARLRPLVHLNDTDSREARQKFMAVVTELFSELGGYENILRRGAFSVSPQVGYAPYVGAAEDVSKESVARHFAMCGVTIPMADNELTPWAREYIRDGY